MNIPVAYVPVPLSDTSTESSVKMHFRILQSGLKDQAHRCEKENQFIKGEECLNEYNS